MEVKDSYVILLRDTDNPERYGIGECALFRGLSAEDSEDYERLLKQACSHPLDLPPVSSIRFGFESAFADMNKGGRQRLEETPFTVGETSITINGLVWMGDKTTMRKRIAQKLDQGFRCIKLKIGGIKFDDEIELLKEIRQNFSSTEIELRLDANGAFDSEHASEKLDRLAKFEIHSIEQPIKPSQWEKLARICEQSPIPIALDEELIGYNSDSTKISILDTIRPSYVILKPSLCGGFKEADRWIALSEERGIGWWATSALESNIGLNAIAQWVSKYNPSLPQGLGTGGLYLHNFHCPLILEGDRLFCSNEETDSLALWGTAQKSIYG